MKSRSRSVKKINKRGIDVMVSYVLLIVIAVAISVLVYEYLKLYLPGKQIECPPDISLIVEQFACYNDTKTLELKLSNRGLFNVSGAFIRFGEETRKTRRQINPGQELFLPSPLSPGLSTPLKVYPISSFLKQGIYNYLLEIQPAVYQDFQLVPCSNVIITQPVFCDSLSSLSTQQCIEDGDCDDSKFCTDDSCLNGVCTHIEKDYDDSLACTMDSCSESTNTIVHFPRNDLCNDGLFCNGDETCSEELGCVDGAPPVCADDGCKLGFCDVSNNICSFNTDGCECFNRNQKDSACEDGNPCTDDFCDGNGHCTEHTSNDTLTCDDGNYCTIDDFCNSGSCTSETSRVCSDSIGCTQDYCDPSPLSNTCKALPINSLCDDNLFCNGDETCTEELGCVDGTPPACNNDGLVCNGDETCTEQFGCNGPDPICVDDGLFCTGVETCIEPEGCSGQPPCPIAQCDEATDSCCAESETTCNDGVDEDCDGDSDCYDSDCAGSANCPCLWGTQNGDGSCTIEIKDIQRDGYVDYIDTDPPSWEIHDSEEYILLEHAHDAGGFPTEPVPTFGFIEWDLSALPNDITINYLKFKYLGLQGSQQQSIDLLSDNNRPSLLTNAILNDGGGYPFFFDSRNEPINNELVCNCLLENSAFITLGLQEEDFTYGFLGPPRECGAVIELQDQLNEGNKWFAIGLGDGWDPMSISSSEGDFTPTLVINYSP